MEESYELIQLDNGLKVLVLEHPEYPVSTIEVLYKAGSLLEDKNNNGISHFVEHMVFQGSKNYPDTEKFEEKMDLIGGSYNGYTSSNKVSFNMVVPDSEIDFAFDYIADITENALFPEDKLENERKVILDEIHNFENSPYKSYYNFWDKHRYTADGKPLEIPGSKEDIGKMNRADLIDWYETVITPENAVITVSSNHPKSEIIKKVRKYFEKQSRKKSFKFEDYFKPQYQAYKIATQVDDTEKQAIGDISFPGPSRFETTLEEKLAITIIQKVLAGFNTSILYKKLRVDLGLLYSINTSYSYETMSEGLLDISFTTSDDKIQKVYEIILSELQNLKDNGLTKKQIELAKTNAVNSIKTGDLSLNSKIKKFVTQLFYHHEDFNPHIYTNQEISNSYKNIKISTVNDMIDTIIKKENMQLISRVSESKFKPNKNELNLN